MIVYVFWKQNNGKLLLLACTLLKENAIIVYKQDPSTIVLRTKMNLKQCYHERLIFFMHVSVKDIAADTKRVYVLRL